MYAQSIIDGFMKVSTASVSDAVDKIAGKRGYMDHEIKPRINEKKVVGAGGHDPRGADDRIAAPQARHSTRSTSPPRAASS